MTPDQYSHPTFTVYMREQSGTLYTIEMDFNNDNERTIGEDPVRTKYSPRSGDIETPYCLGLSNL